MYLYILELFPHLSSLSLIFALNLLQARKENRSLTNKLADFNCTPKRVLFPENRPLLRSCNKPATPPQEIPANPSDKGGKKSFVSENEPHLKTKSNKGKTRKPPRIIRQVYKYV